MLAFEHLSGQSFIQVRRGSGAFHAFGDVIYPLNCDQYRKIVHDGYETDL